MQFRRLTGLERQKIEEEYDSLMAQITDLKDILNNHSRVLEIIRSELTEIKEKYNDKRRSEIIDAEIDMQDEDLIPQEGRRDHNDGQRLCQADSCRYLPAAEPRRQRHQGHEHA